MDSVFERAHFISTHAIITIELFLYHMQKLHSILTCIVFNKDLKFIALFTKKLYHLLEVEILSSIVQHPQLDSQTKQVNQKLDQYLQIFVNKQQNNWHNLLLLVKFQYNNYVYSSTNQPPFLLNIGHLPCIRFEPHQQESRPEGILKFIGQIKSILEKVKSAIQKYCDNIEQYYNNISYFGDNVFLDTLDIYIVCPSMLQP